MNLRLLLTIFLLALSATGQAEALETVKRVRFSDHLYPMFQHPRCLNCHQFGSLRSNGREFHSHRQLYRCDLCHQPRLTGLLPGEWIAPLPSMDYTGLTPQQTCELIKRNMGAPYSDERLLRHMLKDVRIRWALDGGVTPEGKRPTVPGGVAAWQRAVHEWAATGMACD
jgi:hypothetical protein